MINVNQITAQLARMPDQALQQYASMHKNDPYTVSLALAESNRRKEMRTAAQGQQGGEQPKVVDQGIAEMAAPAPQQALQAQAQPMPEDVGIGALPAPNMQGMAGGGIVAFSGADESLVTDPQFGGVTPEAFLPAPSAARNQAEVAAIVQALRARGDTVGLPQILAIQEGRLSAPAGAKTAVAQPVVAPGAAPVPGAGAAPAPGAGGPRPPATPRALAVPEKGFAERLKAAMGENPDEDRFAKRREDITATAKAGAEEGLAKLKADQESEMASMFKGKEERIGKREAALEKSKDTNTGMAFLEAGLAMMQSRGRGLAGIAEGASVGTKQYASGIKDIRTAQEKLDDARDRMEELRQNQSSMNKREVRAEEKGIRDLVTQGQERALAGAEKAYGIKREDMRAAVTSDLTVRQAELDRQNRIQVAGMPGDQQRMLTMLGGKGGLEAGLAKMQEIQADKTGAAYAKLFTETVAEANKAGVTPPTAAQFAASLRQLAVAMNPAKVPTAVDTSATTRP